MNKFTKKLVSVFTACALAVGVMSGTGTITKAATTAGTLVPAAVVDFMAQPEPAATTVTLQGSTDRTVTADSLAQVVHIPMAKKGVLEVGFSATGLSSSVEITLFSDAACTTKVGYATWLSSATLKDVEQYTVSTPGDYYLKFEWSYSVPDTASTIAVLAYAYSGEDVTITDSYQAIYSGDYNTTNYHKLEVASDSLVTVMANSYDSSGVSSSISMNLCDSDKMALDSIYLSSSDGYLDSYALKKGTYYISSSCADRYRIKASVMKINEKSGSSKKKAKLLKKGKTVKGMVALSEGTGKADWYKIKLKKKAKIKIARTAYCTGACSLKVQFIPASKRVIMTSDTVYMKTGSSVFGTRNKMPKGTYYLKVTKISADDSGAYELKLK